MKRYRNSITTHYQSDIADVEMEYKESDEFVTKDDFIEAIDEIESKLKDIKYDLDKITGLSEIDEISNMLEQLLDKLY